MGSDTLAVDYYSNEPPRSTVVLADMSTQEPLLLAPPSLRRASPYQATSWEAVVTWHKLDELVTAVRELSGNIADLVAAFAPDSAPSDLRCGVTAEEAAEEIIRLLEEDDAALRPSELQERLRIPIAVVADGIAVLRQRGWVSGAMTGQPHG